MRAMGMKPRPANASEFATPDGRPLVIGLPKGRIMKQSVELFAEAGFERLREKSRLLTGYLEWLIAEHFAGRIESITPHSAQGAQSSLKVRDTSLDARGIFDALCEHNVTGDWREPDVIRVAPAPLYNNYSDVFNFVERLQGIVNEFDTAV